MEVRKIDFKDTHSFSSFFLDYIAQKENLIPFYQRYPVLENFKSQIADKRAFSQFRRQVLTQQLRLQYAGLTTPSAVEKNLNLLEEAGTFTITTGHQLNVFTGPLYFIFKIVTVINACKKLKTAYPEFNFVPVYWMASEDHDYEEIKSFRLYGNKYTWQTNQQGAVGRFETKDFKNLLDTVPGETTLFREAYSKNKNLAAAVRHYVNGLFGEEGLIVVDGDSRELKKQFVDMLRDDLFTHSAHSKVEAATKKLTDFGYHTQVNAREINLFYLDKDIRSRIEKTEHGFKVVETNLKFSEAEIENLLNTEPEKFSPNVILRPIYQETILPNLAYVGGPAELVYWLQLKSAFDHFSVPFPVLMPRNFGMIVDASNKRKFDKTGLELKDLFEEKNFLLNHWIVKNSEKDLSVRHELETLNEFFAKIRNKAGQIDSTLDKFIGAQTQKSINGLERIEKKMIRAEKRRQKDKLGQIESLKDVLFPNGSLQERTDNFLNFYSSNPKFIEMLLQVFDPFDFRFNVLLD